MKIPILLLTVYISLFGASSKQTEVTLCASFDSFGDDLKFLSGCKVAYGKTLSQAYQEGWRVKAMTRMIDTAQDPRFGNKLTSFVLERENQ